MQTIYIKGAILVFMSHAARQGKIIECDPITGDMPHGNGHISHNMHAKDLVYISKEHHCHCEYIDIQTMSIACILWDI